MTTSAKITLTFLPSVLIGLLSPWQFDRWQFWALIMPLAIANGYVCRRIFERDE